MLIPTPPMSIPVAKFCHLPGTERCLKQADQHSSAAAAPLEGKSRSALHSKNVVWMRKPIYISSGGNGQWQTTRQSWWLSKSVRLVVFFWFFRYQYRNLNNFGSLFVYLIESTPMETRVPAPLFLPINFIPPGRPTDEKKDLIAN